MPCTPVFPQDPDLSRRLLRAMDRMDAGFRDPPGNGWKMIHPGR